MKKLCVAALCILAAPVWAGAALAESSIDISLQNIGFPTDPDVPFGEVPGYVKYRVAANDAELQELLKLIVQDKFSSTTDGTFLVTLAFTAQGKTLAERTLMQGSIKSSSFLWFTTSKTEMFGGDAGDQLLNGMTVDEPSNLLRVSLRAYKTDNVVYDPTAVQGLLTNVGKISPLLAIPQIATGGLDFLNGLAAKILTTSNSKDYTLGEGMQFIKGQSNPQPNHVVFRLRGFDNGQLAVVIHVDVVVDTLPSRLGIYDPTKLPDGSRKGYANYANTGHAFLDSANFLLGSQNIKLWDILETSGPKQITTGIRLLENGAYDPKQNEGRSITAFCQQVYAAISSVYANRDAAGLYWDLLHRLHEGLGKSEGSLNCLTDREPLLKSHGLPTEDLHTLLHQ